MGLQMAQQGHADQSDEEGPQATDLPAQEPCSPGELVRLEIGASGRGPGDEIRETEAQPGKARVVGAVQAPGRQT